MRAADFEWDDDKAASNLAKHSVSFDMAKLAFSDPFAMEFEDRRADYGEERYILIGTADRRLVFVAFTYRAERIRIISARGATPYERRFYHERIERF